MLLAILGALVAAAVFVVSGPSSAPSLADFYGTGSAVPAAPTASPLSIGITTALAQSTVRIVGLGCLDGGYDTGSGWPVAPNYIVTAAHVVSGQKELAVEVPGGPSYLATVVSFNSQVDAAVLYVAGAHFRPFALAPRNVTSGPSLAAGYPLDGPEQLAPVQPQGIEQIPVESSTTSYLDRLNFVAPSINHGDSGGPVLDADGQVMGMMVTIDLQGDMQAVLPSQMRAPISAGLGVTSGVGHGDCM